MGSTTRMAAQEVTLLLVRLAEALAYRETLVQELWRKRNNPWCRQQVADRRRELRLIRHRIRFLRRRLGHGPAQRGAVGPHREVARG